MAIVNRLYTAMTNSQTDLTLSNASGFPPFPGVVQIGSEKIHYVISTPSQLLNLTRAYAGTSAATHAAGSIVTFVSTDEPTGTGDLVGTAPVAVANGTQTLAGQSATISMHVADASHDGYLASADWTTFNNKLATSAFTDAAVTGKLITGYVSGAGTVAATDTILQAIQKLNGNAAAISTVANAALPTASFTDAAVTGKVLTGYVSGAGTVAATDTILQAIQKLNGNDALALPLTGGTLTGALTQQKAPILNNTALATTGTITPDGRLGPSFTIAVSGAVTLNGPSNPVDGQKVTFIITNDASHSVTLATGAGNFAFGTDITSYTNSVSKVDYVGVIYNTTANRWHVVSVIQGF